MTEDAPHTVEVNVADVVITPGGASLTTTGEKFIVLSAEQRSMVKRIAEKLLHALGFIEFVVEVTPDGTVRVLFRPRT